ncbi:MAG: VTT domain-containing protein [Alphaproteobacteria bacterium]
MTEFFQPVLDTIARYPEWAGLIIFLMAAIETIVGIGYLIPGTWLMLSFGLLVGTGGIRFDIAVIALASGGIVGDAAGYWIGKHYGRRLFGTRFFRKHQALVTKSEEFFARHGGKAVFLARMLGPVRPLVPFFAGMARMNIVKFTICNITSAIVAAVAHLVPGMAVGLGLQFTGAMTWRLVVLIVLVTLLAWLFYEVARRGMRFANTTGPRLAERLTAWGHAPERRASGLGSFAAAAILPFVDPRHRAAVAMAFLGIVALSCFIGVTLLLREVIDGNPINHANRAVLEFLNGLHTPWADRVMSIFLGLGSASVLVPLVAAVLVILAARRDWMIGGYWTLTALFAYATATVLEIVVPAGASGAAGYDAFPSSHAAIWVVLLGYLAILCLPVVRGRRWQLTILFAASALVAVISFSQLYFGVLVISSLAGGLLLGLGWLAVLTVVTRRRIPTPLPPWGRTLGLTSFAVLIVAGSLSFATNGDEPLISRARSETHQLVTLDAWQRHAWRELPAYRSDFVGALEEPLNVQLSGDPAFFRAAMAMAGWRDAPVWDTIQTVIFLTGAGGDGPDGGPVLPRFWDGQRETLVLVKPDARGRLVLRLWDNGQRMVPSGEFLLIGTVERELERRPLVFGTIRLPPRAGSFSEAARLLAVDAGDAELLKRVETELPDGAKAGLASWDGTTAIIRLEPGWKEIRAPEPFHLRWTAFAPHG